MLSTTMLTFLCAVMLDDFVRDRAAAFITTFLVRMGVDGKLYG
jgi:hypothetical protein